MFTGVVWLNEINLYDAYDMLAVTLDSGLEKIPFGIDQSIIEEDVPTIDKPFFFGVKRKPIEFELTFARDNNEKWDYEMKLEFVRMFFKPYYQEMRFERYPQIFYRVICVSSPEQAMNAVDHGYVTLKFRTDAPYAYSETYMTTRNVVGATEIVPYELIIENNSNALEYYYPIIEFITNGTTFKMVNQREPDRIFEFTGLVDGETVYVDNENRKVVGDQPYPENYRLNKFNQNWLRLKQGTNTLHIYTDCTFTIKVESPISI